MSPYQQYLDAEWYQNEANLIFADFGSAIKHYLSIGEKESLFPNPLFDPAYYRERNNLPTNEGALSHFIKHGVKHGLDPNRFFNTAWYLWQNPDAKRFAHPMLHYLEIGSSEFRDPSPFIDMATLRGNTGDNGAILLNKTCRNPDKDPPGIHHSYNSLVQSQKSFFDSTDITIHKIKNDNKRKYLLWVQTNENSNFFQWYKETDREWDLLLNFYSGKPASIYIGDHVLSQMGTKFTGIFNVWRYHPEILNEYEYVFFIDDDLVFNYHDIDKFFSIIAENEIGISQPSLAPGSHCAWPVFFNYGNNIRYTNGIEIMMPAFSKAALQKTAPYFCYSVSGFGLDLLFAKIWRDEGCKAAVIDQIEVSHPKIIDQNHGAYYEFLRKYNINSKLELWRLMEMFDLDNSFYEV